LFGLRLPLMVCTNVVCGIMSDRDFFHKEDEGIVLSIILVLVYQNIQLRIPADTVFINLIFRSQYEYFNGKSLLACILFCVAGEHILYLAEMPETEGRVTCELVGDAKVNALNLQVFKIVNNVPSCIRNTYCYIYSSELIVSNLLYKIREFYA